MSWSPELPIGEFRPWPDTVHVVRGRTGEMLRYVPEQAIEATLGRGTCSPIDRHGCLSGTDCPAWECSVCGGEFEAYANYCSNCGRKVVE